MTKNALLCNGPVVWINLIQMSFSGDNGPDAKHVQEVLAALANDGYGMIETTEKLFFFLKALPDDLQEELLERHEVTTTQYREAFGKKNRTLRKE